MVERGNTLSNIPQTASANHTKWNSMCNPLHARTVSILVLSLVLWLTGPGYADHDLDIYAFRDVFVFDTLGHDRVINLVSLQDSVGLKVTGKVISKSSYPLSSYGHYKNSLFAAFHDRVEIYDVEDLAQPELEQTVRLRDRDGNHPLWPKLAKLEQRFFIVAGLNVFELRRDPQSGKWFAALMETPPVIQKQHILNSTFPDFQPFSEDTWPFVVKTTDKFRFEVAWQVLNVGNHREHHKFLRRIRMSDESVDSTLRLGEIWETFGE